MKKLLLILLLISNLSYAREGQVISGLEEKDLPVLNEELRKLDKGIEDARVATGTIYIWPTDTAPDGSLLCYGQAVSRSDYEDLFDVIGTTFGAGDGTTTFNVPDLRGRFPLGQDDMGGTAADRVTDAQADTIGGASGAETKDISHEHSVPIDGWGTGGASVVSGRLQTSSGSVEHAANARDTVSAGSTTQNVINPFITFNYIIKT